VSNQAHPNQPHHPSSPKSVQAAIQAAQAAAQHKLWLSLRAAAPAYAPEAFRFIQDGLGHTAKMVHGEAGSPNESRHVSGQQLCLGLRDYAVQQYGLLAKTVLNRWNIRKTEDFGRLVFAMIETGLMRKTDEDSFEDFVNVFDFDEAFECLQPSAN
jgi:uncharacterized repeat protein (TIGR04138 family)